MVRNVRINLFITNFCANDSLIGSYFIKLYICIKKRGASLMLVPRFVGSRIAQVVETSNADTMPIQRQISCNIQNDNKTCVNANIYSI